jgi:hypothetical protein
MTTISAARTTFWSTALIPADWRDPAAVLGHPGLRKLIDLAEPTGVLRP